MSDYENMDFMAGVVSKYTNPPEPEMKITEGLPPLKGEFVLDIVCARTGDVLEHYEDKNLVVNNGRQIVMQLLGAATAGKRLAKLGVGTNGTEPVGTNMALTGSYVKNLGAVSYPTISSVRFDWTLGAGEGNGIAIREFGILSFDNTLFARKVREVINKNSDIILNGNWTISF